MKEMKRERTQEALERREDKALSEIAKVRDTKNAKTVKHKDAWRYKIP